MKRNLKFGRYKIINKLGQGGMGEVFKAIDPMLDREVALKIITSSSVKDIQIERFLTEARATATIRHPNVITIYDIGKESGKPFYAMEVVTGQGLDCFMKETRSIHKLVSLMIKISRAIGHIHSHRIIHRDLKPSNIMIEKNGEPKIMDFGLAKFYDKAGHNLTSEGMMVGTLNYMSPEQANGIKNQIDQRTGIYSLGVIFYQMLSGELPLESDTALGLLRKIFDHQPVPLTQKNPNVASELEHICLQALEKDKNYRQQSASLLARQLENYLEHAGSEAQKVTHTDTSVTHFKQNTTASRPNPYRVRSNQTMMSTSAISRNKTRSTVVNRKSKMRNKSVSKPNTILYGGFAVGMLTLLFAVFLFNGSNGKEQGLALLEKNHAELDKQQDERVQQLVREKNEAKVKADKLVQQIAREKKRKKAEKEQVAREKKLAEEREEQALKNQKIAEAEAAKAEATQKEQQQRKEQERREKSIQKQQQKNYPQIAGFTFIAKKMHRCGEISHELFEYKHKKTGMVFVLISGEEFIMGTGKAKDEKPHKVRLSTFMISKFEVANREWQQITRQRKLKKYMKYPVIKVSWQEAVDFCRKAKLDLPSEAQWEYSYFAGNYKENRFYWGNEFNRDYAWSYNKIRSVGQKLPNAFGLYDMAGMSSNGV